MRWKRSTLPCDCDEYAGDCRTVMLPPILDAVALSSAMRWSSWSDCSTVLLSVACTRPHSSRKACIACTWYVKSPDLLSVTTAIAMPVSTSIPVRIGVVFVSPSVLK